MNPLLYLLPFTFFISACSGPAADDETAQEETPAVNTAAAVAIAGDTTWHCPHHPHHSGKNMGLCPECNGELQYRIVVQKDSVE